MKRMFIMVMDSFGIGATGDAEKFGDKGANTLGHIAEACQLGKANAGREGILKLPNLNRLGLGKAAKAASGSFPQGLDEQADIIGAWGYASEISSGKDTPSGHWEIAGVPVLFDWGYFKKPQNSFPQELLDKLVQRAGLPGYLGNCHSSGRSVPLTSSQPSRILLDTLARSSVPNMLSLIQRYTYPGGAGGVSSFRTGRHGLRLACLSCA